MGTTRVKICGVTGLEDAELAVSCGAWAIGLVLYGESPRFCETERVAEIATALRRRVEVAGVFVNASLDELVRAAEGAPLTMLQLHGDEGPSYCAEVARRTGLKVIKAACVRDASSVRALSAFKTDFHLLDSYRAGTRGGTGERFDLSLALDHTEPPPLILSGGLTPGNVADAIATVRPFAVDVSSGVEAEPGRKDPRKLRDFFEAVEQTAAASV